MLIIQWISFKLNIKLQKTFIHYWFTFSDKSWNIQNRSNLSVISLLLHFSQTLWPTSRVTEKWKNYYTVLTGIFFCLVPYFFPKESTVIPLNSTILKKKIVLSSLQFQLNNEVLLASFMSHRVCTVSAIHEKFALIFFSGTV